MFSKRIINSGRFLKMPMSSQALYFHLGLAADDDGVVEAFQVMRLVGFAEDDLKVLAAKGLVAILNEDLVSFITDWREHNLIRPDRKINSIYRNLLLRVIPENELVEPRKRRDLKNWTDNGQPMDVQRTTNGPHRLGEVRIVKEKKTISSNGVGQEIFEEKKIRSANSAKMTEEDFKIFWESYPRKSVKKIAQKKFMNLDRILLPQILSAIEIQKKSQQWQNPKFIPMPSTWLNQDRWEDVISAELVTDPLEEKKLEAARKSLQEAGGDWEQGNFIFDRYGFEDSNEEYRRLTKKLGFEQKW